MVKNIIDLDDLSVLDIYKIIKQALQIKENPQEYKSVCSGKILATLFYEPSTRTQMSFQTAMIKLGGSIIGFDNPQNSSVSKGETLKDTLKIVSTYADVIAMRNPFEGSAKAASYYSSVPLINGGDGGHLHPTQTLTDLVTLYSEKGTLDNLCIGLCGDLKNGRTVHSLIKSMVRFKNNKFILISTNNLKVPTYIKDILKVNGCKYEEVSNLASVMNKLDVLYMTRIQKERFESEEEYDKQKGVFVLDTEKLSLGKKDLKVLHPLPRVDEITDEVDNDSRAIYFKQAEYGMYARMALIMELIENKENREEQQSLKYSSVHSCENTRCITQTEKYLPKEFIKTGDMLICEYCEHRMLI